ncbi:MFS transporter [Nakamurella flava]|uniref:MFS transporter n=1 Tax=Nakamurella flava TaxID=2576308 RepID=A0A4U6QAG5_9ACTN|nr:MFS transporter [Nakamurella flava]TKV56911.1 MFS transporter [Nakamurella flava]
MTTRAPERSTAVVRTLLATQFAFNVGFYGVVPFIAVRLHDGLAASGTAIAVTLAVRTFSQQGMFVVGGALADRYGARRVMVAGTVVRTIGYVALAMAGSVSWMIVAAVLTGIGGALFSPALESLLASKGRADDAEPQDSTGLRRTPTRDRLFALLAVCGEVGAVLGPVLGGVLLVHGFTTVALAGAALFAVVGVALYRVLPPGPPLRSPRSRPTGADATAVPASWRVALRDRRFLLFCLAYSSYLLSYNQLYVGLPVELDRVGAGPAALPGLFLLAAVLIIVAQLPIAALTRRLPTRWSLPVGFGLMVAGFVVVAVWAPHTPGEIALWPAITWVVLLTLGQMTVVPVAMDQVGRFAGNQPSGAWYGLLATAGGVAVLLGSFVVGPFLDHARQPVVGAGTAWWLMALFPALSAVVMAVLFRTGRADSTSRAVATSAPAPLLDPVSTPKRNGQP